MVLCQKILIKYWGCCGYHPRGCLLVVVSVCQDQNYCQKAVTDVVSGGRQ